MYPDTELQLYALYGDSITLELSADDRTTGIAEFFCAFDGRDLHGPVHWEKKIAAERALDGGYTRDPLTGLYNRQHALDVIAAMLRKKSSITLCFIDMDGLKEMNDRGCHKILKIVTVFCT